MGSGTLNWFPDRGFELDVEAADEDVAIRLQAVPVPADGTAELRKGVDLDRLDILFKASVEIQGEPAQLQDARIQLVSEGAGYALELDARCEEVETGDIVPFKVTVPIALPSGIPESGGPRPVPTNEDDLDWEDETTLEQLVVNAPEAPITEEGELPPASGRGTSGKGGSGKSGSGKGLQALLKALAHLDEDDDDLSAEAPLPDRTDPEGDTGKGAGGKGSSAPKPSLAEALAAETSRSARNSRPGVLPPLDDADEGPDQSLGADGEARSLLDLLVEAENLELEEDAEIDGLVPGVTKILASPLPAEAKASKLSAWLLDQEQVADLFIGDDDLAEILERW